MHDDYPYHETASPRPRASWIVRSRLLARLNCGLEDGQRLILLSAPAGAGKTTLLGHWLDISQARAAWLSLDAETARPAAAGPGCLGSAIAISIEFWYTLHPDDYEPFPTPVRSRVSPAEIGPR